MVAGECSIIAGVIVTCILAVLSGLCLVLALVFFVYARRKLEQVAFIERSAQGKKAKQGRRSTGDNNGGVVNDAYLADDLNMQEAGSSDQLDGTLPFGVKHGLSGYVVCKEFIPSSHEKWSKGLVQDKLVYRLMAGDVNFEVRAEENGSANKSPFYLAFGGVRDGSPNNALLGGASKLLKSGDRIHSLMLNFSALASSGQLDETMAQLLLKMIRLIDEQPVAFVDVISSAPHERLIDGGDATCVVNITKEEEANVGATAEMRQASESTSESKDSGREETRTNSEHEHDEASSGASSGDDASPQKKPGGGSFIARSRGHSRRSHGSTSTDQAFQSTDGAESNQQQGGQQEAVVIVSLESGMTPSCLIPINRDTQQEGGQEELGEAIELTAQHPAYLGSGGGVGVAEQQYSPLPLPGPDLLLRSPGDDVIVIDTTSSSSSSSDDEKIEPTSPDNIASPRNSSCHLKNDVIVTQQENNTKLEAYTMAL